MKGSQKQAASERQHEGLSDSTLENTAWGGASRRDKERTSVVCQVFWKRKKGMNRWRRGIEGWALEPSWHTFAQTLGSVTPRVNPIAKRLYLATGSSSSLYSRH